MYQTIINQNPQWTGKKYSNLLQRKVFELLKINLQTRYIQTLTGIRRSRKTSLFEMLINKFIIAKTVFLIILLSYTCNINAQSWQDPDNAVQLSDDFDQTRMQVAFFADNKDFCDYHVQVSFTNTEGFEGMPKTTFLTVARGKRQILNYKVKSGATSYSYRYSYMMYRGSTYKFPNIDFAYRLPVTDGDEISSEITENQFGYQLLFLISNDTLYACRGGIICDDNLKDLSAKGHQTFNSMRNFSQITIYHSDASFGEYVFNGKSLVSPGKIVKMGDPIAILKKNDNENDNDYKSVYWILFSTYFLDKNKVQDNSHGNKHTHFRPFFQTSNYGKTRLENDINYLCQQTDEMLMQDMNKSQRKSYLKNKSKQITDEK